MLSRIGRYLILKNIFKKLKGKGEEVVLKKSGKNLSGSQGKVSEFCD